MSSSSGGSGLSRSGTFPTDIAVLKTAQWKKCSVCGGQYVFKTPRSFTQHLRDFHCTREGGSFVCRYGMNGICSSLPLEGVSDRDYEDHVARDHVSTSSLHVVSSESDLKKITKYGSKSEGSAAKPAVVEDQHRWTIYNSAVNLPAALNDPRLSKRDNDFFTKTWGASFHKTNILPSPYLPEISINNFEKYFVKNGSKLRKHKKVVSLLAAKESTDKHSGYPTDTFPSLLQARTKEAHTVDLEQVPKLFLQHNFSLDNPETFNQVFPWSKLESGALGSKGKAKHSSKLLQEKMSHYLDIIEQQIACQISAKSDAFFRAMASHDELNAHMIQTLSAIKCLRDKIRNLDRVHVEGSMKVMKYSHTKSNCVILFNKLNLMATVHQTQPTIQMLLSTCEFVGALDLIATTKEVLNQELIGVTCFRHLGSQLAELEKLIDKMMHSEFTKFITSDLNRHVSDTLGIEDEDRLTSILLGLLRRHKLQFIDAYREEACTALKVTIKQTIVEIVSNCSNSIEVDGNVFSLADQMRLLNFTEWMKMLNAVFASVLVILTRVKNFHHILLQVLHVANTSVNIEEMESLMEPKSDNEPVDDAEVDDTPGNPFLADEDKPGNPFLDDMSEVESQHSVVDPADTDAMLTAQEYMKVYNSAREMINQVCDHAHDRCVKLLLARAKDNFLERLSSGEFVRLSREVESFASNCEEICGRRSTSLRGSLQSQANRFVNRFHEERKTKLSLILDSERWKQADVPAEFQLIVHHIHSEGKLTLPEKRCDAEVRKPPTETLIINNEKYAVVGTVLMLLKMVIEYCQVVEDIPSATPDVLSRLIELLKMFNSRTCQLVLGAGALQLVGLKTITTKNLALAARCLQLIIFHLPLVRQHFETRLTSKQKTMLKHFDQINKDYNDHVQEVFNQLLVITDSVLEQHLANWEMKAPVPSSCFRSLCKQLNRLHEALCDIISLEELLSFFCKVNESFKRKLLTHLRRLNIPVDAGPQNGLLMAELAFYSENLKSLQTGFKDFDPGFKDVWEKR